jgi:HSP20 family protein
MSTLITRTLPAFSPVADQGFAGLMRSMLNDPAFGSSLNRSGSWIPAVEVAESNDALTLTAELPGMEEKHLKISIENNVLTIAGEKEQELTDAPPAKTYYVNERYYGAFQRSFALPRTVDVDHVKAVFDKGVLSVTLPKLPQAKGRQIEVTKG